MRYVNMHTHTYMYMYMYKTHNGATHIYTHIQDVILQCGKALCSAASTSSLCLTPGVSLRPRLCSLCRVWSAGRPACVIDGQWLSSSSCKVSLTAARCTRPASPRYLHPEKSRRCSPSKSTALGIKREGGLYMYM